MSKRFQFVFIASASLLALGAPAQAMEESTGNGNGGDVVYCKAEDGRESAMILDFYEAEIRGIELGLGGPELSVREKVESVLEKLTALSPKRGDYYSKQARPFLSDLEKYERESKAAEPRQNLRYSVTMFLSDEQVDVPDSDHRVAPTGCEIRQLVVQRKPEFREDRLYTITRRYWDLLDNTQKAGMVLHEVAYREALDHKHQNSRKARYFNSKLTSAEFGGLTREEFARLVANVDFRYVEQSGFFLKSDGIQFHAGGEKVSEGVLFANATFRPLGSEIQIEGGVRFDENGRLVAAGLSNVLDVPSGSYELTTRKTLSELHPNGIPKVVFPAFSLNGFGIPANRIFAKTASGRTYTIPKGMALPLDEQGFAIWSTSRVAELDDRDLLDLTRPSTGETGRCDLGRGYALFCFERDGQPEKLDLGERGLFGPVKTGCTPDKDRFLAAFREELRSGRCEPLLP